MVQTKTWQMRLNRLTAVKVQQVRKPGLYADGGGLHLQVTQGIDGALNKSWLFRFSVRDAAKRSGRRERWKGLGAIGTVSLADARAAALDARKLCLSGIDPIEARNAAKVAAALADAKAMTFGQCRDAYIKANKTGWKNEKHQEQWTNTLTTYVTPVFGKLPVAAVDTALVLKVLEPIWATKSETASRVRQRIERGLGWAKVRGFRAGDNPARWEGHLDHLLPGRAKVRKVKHHPALPYVEIPAFMADLRAREGISARALEFTVLTATRTEAVIGATWDEIDLDAKVWTVPPSRAGAKITGEETKPRRVPLSDRAVEILKSLPREEGNPYAFIGAKAGKPLSNMAMLELMRGIRSGYVPHGFRSTFKDWCSETTNYPNEVSEAALWHVVADKVEAAYRRGELFEKRRRLMAAWADFCAKAPTSSKVVSIAQGRR